MSRYNDTIKCVSNLLVLVIVTSIGLVFIFFAIQFLNKSAIPIFSPAQNSTNTSQTIFHMTNDPFGSYRDFVTTITGLLTLIIGAIGIGSYISFRKFKEEEEKIKNRRNQLDMFLKIEEGRNISESEAAYSTAISLYDEAEVFHNEYHMLYTLRGESYYYRNSTGDLQNAICDFETAIRLKKNSSRAWFGLGQACFRLIQNIHCHKINETRDLEGRTATELRIADNDGSIESKHEVNNAMGHIEKALSFQYAETPARLELGRMYKSIGDNAAAIEQYKKAYESNKAYAACGFKYALLWISENDGRLNDAEKEGIIDILKKASVYDLFNSKAAYALLWYLFERIGKMAEANKAKSMTDQLIINDIFELR